MNKENVPQDLGALGKLTTEVCYVTDENGKYVTQLSNGWKIKSDALDVAWHDIEKSCSGKTKSIEQRSKSIIILYGIAGNGYRHFICIYRLLEVDNKKTHEAICLQKIT